MKHLKTLGLAALAVMALTAFVGVSSASAAEFHADVKTALTGEQVNTHEFIVTGSPVKCNNVKFNGTASANGTATIQNVHPVYNNCTAFGIAAKVNTDGCEYEFDANLNTVNLKNCTNGRVTLEANSFLGNCEVDVPEQTGINGQTFTNMGNTGSNTATLTETSAATNITVTVTESNGVCPLTVGHHNDGKYNGLTGIMGATGGTSV